MEAELQRIISLRLAVEGKRELLASLTRRLRRMGEGNSYRDTIAREIAGCETGLAALHEQISKCFAELEDRDLAYL